MTLGITTAQQYIGCQEVRDKIKLQTFFHQYAHAGDISIDPSQIPWCAAFMNACERSVGNPGTGRLNARSFLTYGNAVNPDDAQEGDILIFDFEHNGINGHVTYFVSWDDADNIVKALGGNQSNCVQYSNYVQDYLIGVRRF